MAERKSMTMLCRKAFIFLVFFLLVSATSLADVRLPALFSDNMVIQHGMNIPVWGWADPGEKVRVKIGGYMVEAETNKKGKWKVMIGPLEAGGPFEMLVTGKNTLRIVNVLVGEVWVASGQSNMAMEVRSCLNADEEISKANNPMIRHFQVKRTKASEALEDVAPVNNPKAAWLNTWEISDPATVGHFSGTAYFFARNLFEKLDIPVGIIHTSWGGTTAEAWTPMDTLENDPGLKTILEDWPAYNDDEEWLKGEYSAFLQQVEKARSEGNTEPLYFNQPSVLYNGMVAPIIPYGIRGVIWYQGESNAYRASQYRDLFPAMITQWRRKWAEGDFPFLFVQLANYHFEPQVFPALREAQSMALRLPGTAMAVTIDIGDSTDIHPKNKQEVGRRLALAAEKVAYNADIVFSGPIFKKMFIEDGKCWLLFDELGDGLIPKGGEELRGFTIAGTDRNFLDAKARIDGEQVVVWHEDIEHPIAVRYAWANHPGGCNLYNISGGKPYLPASPFRTDHWPVVRSSRAVDIEPSPLDSITKVLLAHKIRDSLESLELYNRSDDIINGSKWTFAKEYKGNPYLAEDYWPTVVLMYKGARYTGFKINYDLYHDNLILLYNKKGMKRYIALGNEYLQSFSYVDSVNRQAHFYEYMKIPGTSKKDLYEKVYDGPTEFIIRPLCEVRLEPSGGYPGEYIRSFEYYIRIEDRYQSIQSRKSLLKALNRNIPEIKKYIRKNRLKINRQHPENIVPVLKYFDEIS